MSFYITFSLSAIGQKHQNNWFFGKNAALEFTGMPISPNVLTDNAMDTKVSSCISDSTTGELLFYTDGVYVWNKNNQKTLDSLPLALRSQKTLIVPKPGNNNQFYIFTVHRNGDLSRATIDITLDNGLGNVVRLGRSTNINTFTASAITAVKHQLNNDNYWLISHHSNMSSPTNHFYVWRITKNGFQGVSSFSNHIGFRAYSYKSIVSNHQGNKIAVTHYADNPGGAYVQVFDFDKLCGTLSNPITLHLEPNFNYPYGAAFSPDDSKLYISYSNDESQIVQYSGNNFRDWSIVATNSQNFDDIKLGPDGRLYINKHDNGSPSSFIDVIHNPNASATEIVYEKSFINLGIGRSSNFEFPNLITDKSVPKDNLEDLNFNFSNICKGDSTQFFINPNIALPDSVNWFFYDINTGVNTSSDISPKFSFSDSGSFNVTLHYFRCGNKFVVNKFVNIIDLNSFSLGADTSFCNNRSITLNIQIPAFEYLWNTGDTTQNIIINKPGLYWVKITTPTCATTDSIYIEELPPILIDLGSGYTVCEHDTANLVKLDAGKGYNKYKWTPTGDTTQWIIVREAGSQYVIVEDYRGCKGHDGTNIERICGFDFHLPNAFTPNGDGLNDEFKATALDILDLEFEIYNSWGERVFMTNNPQQGWDGTYKGKPCPEGVYLYKIRFKGYSNKLMKVFNYKGNVSLLR